MSQLLDAWTAIGKDLSFLESPFRVQPNNNTTDLNTPFHRNAIKQAVADISHLELDMWKAFISPAFRNGHVTY